MFSYKQEVQDKTLWITPNAKFSNAQGGGGTNTSLARHLQHIWNTDARTLGTTFADLSTPDGAGSYKETLDVLSGRGFSAVTAARYDASVRLVNSAFSCPTFVDSTAVLNAFLTTGVSCLSDHDWETQARFANAPVGVDRFTTRLDTPDVIGRVGAGIEVFNEGSLNVRAQYKADLASGKGRRFRTIAVFVPLCRTAEPPDCQNPKQQLDNKRKEEPAQPQNRNRRVWTACIAG